MRKARARGRRPRSPALSGQAREAHLGERLQGGLAGLDQAPDHADQRKPLESRRLARPQVSRRADGKALLRAGSRRGFGLRTAQGLGHYLRVLVTTPAFVPRSSTSAPRRAKSPLVTTPAMPLIAFSSSTGFKIDNPRMSTTTFPLSVVNPSRSWGWPPSFTIWRAT